MGKNIRLFRLFSFFDAFDFYIPLKIVYFYQITGSYTTAASIISFTWIFAALLELPTGIFSDLIGRKKTIVVGSLCSLLAYLMYALGFNYWIFILGAFLEGASRSFYSGNNNAYMHNVLSESGKENEYHHLYGLINSIMGTAGFLAALLSGFIAHWSITFFMWINLIPQLLAFITTIFLKEIHHNNTQTNIYSHLKEALWEIKENINLRYLSLSSIFGGAGLAAFEFQVAVYSAVWPTWAIGIARAIQEAGVIPGFFYAGKIIDKIGAVKIMTISMFTSVLGNILAGISKSFISPFFIMASLPLYGPSDTAEQSLLQKEFTEKQRATIASLNSLGSSIYFSIVLYICGIIANQYGPFVALIVTQIFIIPSLYFKILFLRKIN